MNDRQMMALYGCVHLPFSADIPDRALWIPPTAELFLGRVVRLTSGGGFALIVGETGLGKSKILQAAAARLREIDGLSVGVMQRPQSSVSDFYREMGELFRLNLSPANRYGGFKRLREVWREHAERHLLRPALLVDEAQEMPAACLSELRLLSSDRFDGRNLLTVALSGDARLLHRFRDPSLAPLCGRIRARLNLKAYSDDEMRSFLEHQLEQAGCPALMTAELKDALVGHAGGNLRVLTHMASDLMEAGAAEDASRLDEKLFVETFSPVRPSRGGRRGS